MNDSSRERMGRIMHQTYFEWYELDVNIVLINQRCNEYK